MNPEDIKPPFVYEDELLTIGCIVGVVTAQGVVESRFTGNEIEHHDEFWPVKPHCCWRWNYDKAIYWFTPCNKPDEQQYSAIQNHLTRKYGIQWFGNGYHDWEKLSERKDEIAEQLEENKSK